MSLALSPAPPRPHCDSPGACDAKGAGHCRACHGRHIVADPEVRARMSEATKRALADPEVRARMSEARKRAWADPEVRARISEARKRAWADPEVRARMSAASKRALARRAVVAAGLHLWRVTVDRAAALLAAGESMEVVIDALQQEARL